MRGPWVSTAITRSCGVSHPTVSETIGDLEHTFGVRLFDRNPHGVEPTVYGAALMKRGTTVFDELRQGVSDIDFIADPTAGDLRLISDFPDLSFR